MTAQCPCYACTQHRYEGQTFDPMTSPFNRMFLCAICGNKRCPHASDHRYVCSLSNISGQPGSNYGPEDIGDDDLRNLVRRMCAETGTARAWAAAHGLHEEQVNVFLRGHRQAQPAMLRALGLTRTNRYAPASAIEARRAAATQIDAVHESAVPEGDAR